MTGRVVVVRERDTVSVLRDAGPKLVTVTRGPAAVVVVRSPMQGPPGPVGLGPSGQPRFTGEGPPGVVIGANPGDEYLDNLTGTLYRLT